MTDEEDTTLVPPTVEDVLTYLNDSSLVVDSVQQALDAELASQRMAVDLPESGPWPADLAEALFRRVAHNLALRNLPLGVSSNVAEYAVATTRVAGLDAEVRRLEDPHRHISIG